MLMIANRTQAVPIAKRCMLQHRNQGIGRALTEASIKYVMENEPKCDSITRVVSTEHMQHNSKYGMPYAIWVSYNLWNLMSIYMYYKINNSVVILF